MSRASREVGTPARLGERQEFLRRLLERDASLWSDDPSEQALIANRLGWVTVHAEMARRGDELKSFAEDVAERGYTRAVLLGMGGSSLAPEVFQRAFGNKRGHPPLSVLDTTDPSAILALDRELDYARTLFIVSSKSGTTIETLSLYRYFAEKLGGGMGEEERLDNFVAITDPETPLAEQARRAGFRHVFENPPDIGGRYSALSYFGLVPAVAIGLDVARLLERAGELDADEGAELGAALAEHAAAGRDKVTFLAPSFGSLRKSGTLESFGAWAEQLLAESLGKQGKGVIPVQGEPVGPPNVYRDDRVFVRLRVEGAADELEEAVRILEEDGLPVLTFGLRDEYDLGREFLRWEIATAALGVALGVNPFDEPNVAESKENTREVLEEAVRAQRLPEPQPAAREDGIAYYYDERTRERLGLDDGRPLESLVAALSGRSREYFAIQAYIQPTAEHDRLLQDIRTLVRDATRLATTLGYGPRFLHSTGQLHKGGPDSGVFFQIRAEDAEELPIPGESGYGFSTLKRAQALGDVRALQARGRRVVRVHLGADVTAGLRRLAGRVRAAVGSGSRG